MRTAIIFRERLLAPSETFIAEQAHALRHYSPVLAGLRRVEPTLQHDLPELLLSRGSGTMDKMAAMVYRRIPFAPLFIRRLRALNPRVLHAHFATDAIQALPIAKALHLPLIVSLHGCDVTPTDAHFRGSSLGRHFLSHREELFARTSVFLCVSKFIRDVALRAGFPENKLRVHYTGIDCRRFCPSDVIRDPKLILFVGRLVEVKGCEYLLRAMEIVQRSDPMARLEIIGDGPLRLELEALASRLALRACFRGTQSSAEVLRSMSRARILCNPSVTAASGAMEAFGMVFAEAQAVGTPVVTFTNAAMPEAVKHGETGLLCPERDVGALAESLLTFLEDEGSWSSASERATTWVQGSFDIAKQTRKLEDIYDACLEQHQCKDPGGQRRITAETTASTFADTHHLGDAIGRSTYRDLQRDTFQ